MSKRRLSTSERLKKMLEAEGFRDIELFPATGAYRTNKRLDCAPWHGWAKRGEYNALYSLISFDTMTDLVKHGFTIANEFGAGLGSFELYRKEA